MPRSEQMLSPVLSRQIVCSNLATARVHVRRLAEENEDIEQRSALRTIAVDLDNVIRKLEAAIR